MSLTRILIASPHSSSMVLPVLDRAGVAYQPLMVTAENAPDAVRHLPMNSEVIISLDTHIAPLLPGLLSRITRRANVVGIALAETPPGLIVRATRAGIADCIPLAQAAALDSVFERLSPRQSLPSQALSEAEITAVFDLLPGVVIAADLKQNIIHYVSGNCSTLLGYTPAQLLDRPLAMLFATTEAQAGSGMIAELTRQDGQTIRAVVRRADGLSLPVDLHPVVVHHPDASSLVLGLSQIATVENVQQMLREAQLQLLAVLSEAPILVFAVDTDGVIMLAEGRSMERLTEGPERLVGMPIAHIFPKSDVVRDVQRAINGERLYHQRQLMDGVFEIFYSPIMDIDDRIIGAVGVAIDVTDREAAREASQQAALERAVLEKEREVMRFREGFISMVSHEFRTPLTIIQSSGEMIAQYAGRLSAERQATHIKKILAQTTYMRELLDDVLMVNMAKAGRLVFTPQPVDLVAFAGNLIVQIGFDGLLEKHFEFYHSGVLDGLEMDTKLLRHILTNLLTNAEKYTPVGGRIELAIWREDDHVILRVSDTGIGIPERDQKHLFEPFRRASNTTGIQGTGLGLTLVQISAETHGGSIDYSSQVGQGSTFTVTLPALAHPEFNQAPTS